MLDLLLKTEHQFPKGDYRKTETNMEIVTIV